MTNVFKGKPGKIIVPGMRKFYRDAIINAGSEYLFDFEREYCNPHPRNALFDVGAQFRNLVDGAPVATVFGNAVLNGAPGKGIALPGINDHGVDFGVTYEEASGQRSFMVSIWLMRRTGDAAVPHSPIIGRAGSIGSYEYYITSHADGNSPVGAINLSAQQTTTVGPSFTLDVATHLAIAWAGDRVYGFRDGVQTFTNPRVGPLQATAGTEGLGRKTTAPSLGFNTAWEGSVFRVYKEDLSAMAATFAGQALQAARQADKEFSKNTGRFS
jgi:hypothetical protein